MNPTLYVRRRTSFPLLKLKIRDASDERLLEISSELGIGLSLQEMKAIQNYFRERMRNPTDVELQTIGQTWSEHCYHKTFKGQIAFQGRKINSLFDAYIAAATRKINPDWCLSVFEDNAGIVRLDQEHGIAVKVETHNHPSAVEPFGGAATGTGGVIRDILGVWAEPIACTDVLGFGPLDFEYKKLPSGVKHPKYVYMGVVAGIGSYGNNMGIPTVNGAVYFDESYVGNVVVYCGCVGLLPIKKFIKNGKAKDLILLAGGKTGRDGIHGVTFASAELTQKSEVISRPAVQIANPIEQEKLKRAVIAIRDDELASSITDLGGGGLSSAVGETAKRFSCGALVHLDRVPVRYRDLSPWEIYISESQERMLLTAPPENLRKIQKKFDDEDVEAVIIGELTANNFLTLFYQNEKVGEMEMSFMFSPPKVTRVADRTEARFAEPEFPEPESLTNTLLQLLSSPNIASRESIIRTYDHEVKGNTVLKPLQGKHAGPNDAAVLKPLANSWAGIALSCGMNPNYGRIDAFWMAASAIDEAIRNNVAVGGRRIALLDNFTWGNPERPERLGSLVRACQACYRFATEFQTPFISGKDSLYNESPLGPITPTLLITAVGLVPDIRATVSMDVKVPNNLIYIVGETFKELGGSEYYRAQGYVGKSVPKMHAAEAKKTFPAITKAIDLGLVKACHDLSEGGLAVASAEMAFGGGYGLNLDLTKVPCKHLARNDFILFSESNSRFLVEIPSNNRERFERLMKQVVHSEIGRVSEAPQLVVHGLRGEIALEASLDKLKASWKETLSRGPNNEASED